MVGTQLILAHPVLPFRTHPLACQSPALPPTTADSSHVSILSIITPSFIVSHITLATSYETLTQRPPCQVGGLHWAEVIVKIFFI
jgi:hypothetical protein